MTERELFMSSGVSSRDVFWGLQDNWWKQIYDGRVHHYGREVFDKGLHKGPVEPGYYDSIEKASQYAASLLGTPLTLEIYKTIHSLACAHFAEVERAERNVDDENIHKFRATHCRCSLGLQYLINEPVNSREIYLRKMSFFLMNEIRSKLMINYQIDSEFLDKQELSQIAPEIRSSILQKILDEDVDNEYSGVNVQDVLKNGNPLIENALEAIKAIENEQARIKAEYNLDKPLISIGLIDKTNPTLRIHYVYQDPSQIEKFAEKMIASYNEKMKSLPSDPNERTPEENELALRYIANLFQELEWLHPFFDGQGRTDLVLLVKLLSENGFNPAILYNPYYSSFEPLEKWITYLKKGMETWRVEFDAMKESKSLRG